MSKKKRSKELLFALFTEQDAYFIDVKKHNSFSDKDLLEIIDANWSELIEPHLFNVDCEQKIHISDDERSKLRKAHLNVITVLNNGKALFSMGGGMATSGDSVSSSMILNNLYHTFDDILDYIEAVKSHKEIDSLIQFQTEVRLGIDELSRLYICDERSTCIIPIEYMENKAKKYADKKFQALMSKHIQSQK